MRDDQPPVLHATDAARLKVLDLRAGEGGDAGLALWVEVSGQRDGEYTYDLYFQEAGDAGDDDWTATEAGLTIVVPADSVDRLTGSVLDVSRAFGGAGLSIQNPNRPPAPPMSPTITAGSAHLHGDVAQRVVQVLEGQINPSIAAHGGRADLVAVEDGAAFLRLSGGCAGCGMAAVTLGQGIEVAIRQAVPEVSRVVDVTDHASGTNPYYEPAKK